MDPIRESHRGITTLEADSILLEYQHRKVLQNIYIRIEKGKITGLLGRNGCGKSSLIEIIYGIRQAQYSSVRLDGRFVRNVYKQKDVAAYLPQHPFVPGHMKVGEALLQYESALPEALDYFPELEKLLPNRFNSLSGGEQRLVETVMVISGPASFVILDEPFSNVMPLHVETLKYWLSVIKSRKGILITDHYYQDVLAVSDQVYLLTTEGRTVALEQPVQQLKDLGYIN